jgi:hypothetical protein
VFDAAETYQMAPLIVMVVACVVFRLIGAVGIVTAANSTSELFWIAALWWVALAQGHAA